MKCNKGI